jgi:hypothetical protein
MKMRNGNGAEKYKKKKKVICEVAWSKSIKN